MVLEYLVMIRYFSFYTWVLGNEFGSGPRPHPHTHAVIVTTEKMNFEEFKKQWKKETKIKIADIQRSKHFSTDVKYVSRTLGRLYITLTGILLQLPVGHT